MITRTDFRPFLFALEALVKFFLIVFVVMLVMVVATGGDERYKGVALLTSYGLGGLYVVASERRRIRTAAAGVAGSWHSLPRVGLWVVVTTLGLTCIGISAALGLRELGIPGFQTLPPNRPYDWATILTVVVAAPLVEELLFRGVTLRFLLPACRPERAIVVSAALFVVMHGYPVLFPHIFLLGLLWGWCYWKTGSIWPGVAGHFALNLAAMVGGVMAPGAQQDKAGWVLAPVFVFGIVVAGVGSES